MGHQPPGMKKIIIFITILRDTLIIMNRAPIIWIMWSDIIGAIGINIAILISHFHPIFVPQRSSFL